MADKPDQQLAHTEQTIDAIGNAPVGMTSEQAAALFLSEGATDDPQLAQSMSAASLLDLDAMQRSYLQRMMGFDFQIKITPNKIHVYSKDGTKLSTHCKLHKKDMDKNGNVVSEKAIDRLVDACMRLKLKWDSKQLEDSNVRSA